MNVQTIAYPKEQMHRVAYTKLTSEQIAAKLAAAAGPRSASPLSDAFAGQSLQIVTDKGPTLRYRFASNDRLSVAEKLSGSCRSPASNGSTRNNERARNSGLRPPRTI